MMNEATFGELGVANPDHSFSVEAGESGLAEVKWDMQGCRLPMAAGSRLCLKVEDGETEETIFLGSDRGEFRVPLQDAEKPYAVHIGLAAEGRFETLYKENVAPTSSEKVGALSGSHHFRGAHFWPVGTAEDAS